MKGWVAGRGVVRGTAVELGPTREISEGCLEEEASVVVGPAGRAGACQGLGGNPLAQLSPRQLQHQAVCLFVGLFVSNCGKSHNMRFTIFKRTVRRHEAHARGRAAVTTVHL